METVQPQAEAKKRSKLPVILPCVLLGLAAAAYLGFCAYASTLHTFYPNYTINGVEVGGMSAQQAQSQLERSLPKKTVSVAEAGGEDGATLAAVTLEQLGYNADSCAGAAQRLLQYQRANGFFSGGWNLVKSLVGAGGAGWSSLTPDEETLDAAVEKLADTLDEEPIDGGYTLDEDTIYITKAKDGRAVDQSTLRSAIDQAVNGGLYRADISFSSQKAQELTVEEIYEDVSGEMKNAGYDSATKSIIPEEMGADFDAARAAQLLDAADPGQTVSVPAVIQRPAVTAEELKDVLFRDVLGTYTTHVGGTAARISNVKLAAAAFDGTVLNSGDIFSYNETVGQRTVAKGYQAAPAYVKGETVDEIGGGVCQPSSTLYLATLKANLEIVERYAHRYVPAYIPKGMDATVSWGGPDYKFANNTDYPIKIEAVYSKNYLTTTLYGTKTDDIEVKMTNKVLSTTPFEVVYEDDPTLPAGTETVKVTPYTGYKVETYRNLYDGQGNLISSSFEATSDYKARNKLILRGPAAVSADEPLPDSGILPPVITVPDPPAQTDGTPDGGAVLPDGGSQSEGQSPAAPEMPENEETGGTSGGAIITPLPVA